MTVPLTFALNHMCVPKLDIESFFRLARSLGITAVEIRNDLEGRAILDGTRPETIRGEAERAGITVLSINALQKFNHWNETRAAEADELISYAGACDARALVLVPANDGSRFGETERKADLREALAALAPKFSAANLTGLVEPLGFESSSLRYKSEAAAAIRELGDAAPFRMVHDTFHHHLAGEAEIFPELTGLIHVSGVTDKSLAVGNMRDANRVLVDSEDRLENVAQLALFVRAGMNLPLSFEPFSAEIHSADDPAQLLEKSMRYITEQVEIAVASTGKAA
jgi:2-keto-myo-inositol isomerase